MIRQWDIWLVDFPFEDSNEEKSRPVIVLNAETLEVLSVKITSHTPRTDPYDVPITKWQESGLKHISTARISKTMYLNRNKFKHCLGNLHPDDRIVIMQKYMDYVRNH